MCMYKVQPLLRTCSCNLSLYQKACCPNCLPLSSHGFTTVPLLCPLAAATGSGGCGGAAEGAGAGPDTDGQYDP